MEKPRFRIGELIDKQRTGIVIMFRVPRIDATFYVASSSAEDNWMLDNFARQFQKSKFQRRGNKTVASRWSRKVFAHAGREFYIAIDRGKQPDSPFYASWLYYFLTFQCYVERYNQNRWFRYSEQTKQLFSQFFSGD